MTQAPQIITPEGGFHNADLHRSRERLLKGSTYRDLSTVCIVPTRGMVPVRVLQSWLGLMAPMNQKFIRLFMTNMEVGDAYEQGVAYVLSHPDLCQWKYLLTLEEDNMPPPDGLLKLYEAIEGKVDGQKYGAVGGLYWTKGEGGQPMIYGDPAAMPLNFIPQIPKPDTTHHCNGLGMGFTLFRMSMLADARMTRPLFKTEQSYMPGVGSKAYTQDLYFFEKAAGWGYRFACDTRVKVGHYDHAADMVW